MKCTSSLEKLQQRKLKKLIKLRNIATIGSLLVMLTTAAVAAPVHKLKDIPDGTIRMVDMLDKKYMPKPCSATRCILTGPGGIEFFWTYHVEQNLDKTFIVRGKCESACYLAYKEAVRLGAKVKIERGASFGTHRPSKVRFD